MTKEAFLGAGLTFSIAIMSFGSVTGASAEQATSAAASCLEIQNPLERLRCYDEVFGFERPDVEAAIDSQLTDGTHWHVETETSALDGRTDVWLRVMSENTQPNQIGRATRAYFWVRCMQNTTNAFITFESYTARDQQVRYKLDEAPVQTVRMETMDGGRGIGLWSGRRAIPFVRELFGSSEIVVGYASYSDRNLEFTFNISGLRDQIGPLADSCGWTP